MRERVVWCGYASGNGRHHAPGTFSCRATARGCHCASTSLSREVRGCSTPPGYTAAWKQVSRSLSSLAVLSPPAPRSRPLPSPLPSQRHPPRPPARRREALGSRHCVGSWLPEEPFEVRSLPGVREARTRRFAQVDHLTITLQTLNHRTTTTHSPFPLRPRPLHHP